MTDDRRSLAHTSLVDALGGPLVLAVGQVILPIAGWVVGVVLIAISPLWRRSEKWSLLTAGPAIGVAVGVIAAIVTLTPVPTDSVGPSVLFNDPSTVFFSQGYAAFLVANLCAAAALAHLSLRRRLLARRTIA